MAKKTINLGSIVGAHIYDDTDFPAGLNTDGPLRTSNTPSNGSDVIRQDDIGGGGPAAPSDATYIVVSLDGDLSAERVLAAGDGIAISDGGANGNITVSIDSTVAIADLTDNSGGASPDDTLQSIPDPSDTPADADTLRDDLVANTLPAVRNDIADLADKVNQILTALRNTSVIST